MFTWKMVWRGIGWFFFGLFAVLIGLYPIIYFFVDRSFGLLGSKPAWLLSSIYWNTGFYLHIIPGGVALLIGWMQFSTKLRLRYLSLHRGIGKIYVVAAIVSAMAGISIGFFATGGFIAAAGFICLGIVWFTTTLYAFVSIRQGKIVAHQRLMIYSYAACFAAVTLRIWLPLLTTWLGDFNTAYRIVAWLCWLPNMFVASLLCRRLPAPVV